MLMRAAAKNPGKNERRLRLPDGRGAAEEEFSERLEPGRAVFLYYQDDPGVWHAALLLYPEGEDWYILTPDGDVYLEDVCARTQETVAAAALGKMDRSAPRGLRGQLYQFRSKVSDATLEMYMAELRDQVPGDQPEPKRWIDSSGLPHLYRPVVAREESPRRGLA